MFKKTLICSMALLVAMQFSACKKTQPTNEEVVVTPTQIVSNELGTESEKEQTEDITKNPSVEPTSAPTNEAEGTNGEDNEPLKESEADVTAPTKEPEMDEDKLSTEEESQVKEDVKEPTKAPTTTPKPTTKPTATPKPTTTPKPTATPKPTSTPKPTTMPTPTKAPTPTPTLAPEVSKSIDIESVMSKIMAVEDNAMIRLDDEMFQERYYLDSTKVANYVVYMPMMMVKSTEYAIIEAKSLDDVKSVKEGVQKHVDDLIEQWKNYLPDQYELVQNCKVITKDRYVALIISTNLEYAENVFLRAFDPSIPEIVMKAKYYEIIGEVLELTDTKIKLRFFDVDGKEATLEGKITEWTYFETMVSKGDKVMVYLNKHTELPENGILEEEINYVERIIE